jgi:hypothetical protein
LSLLHRSIQTVHQESSDTQPHRPTREISETVADDSQGVRLATMQKLAVTG